MARYPLPHPSHKKEYTVETFFFSQKTVLKVRYSTQTPDRKFVKMVRNFFGIIYLFFFSSFMNSKM